MTAGSGIIHQEMPEGGADGRLWGLQLWTNLPRSHKMMAPRYREIKAEDIPEVVLDSGARVKVICGTVGGIRGPVQDIVAEPEYLDITVPARSRLQHRVTGGYTALAYVLEGAAHFDEESKSPSGAVSGGAQQQKPQGTMHGPESVVLYERDGDEIVVTTENEEVQFILITGKPIGEPVAWAGPIVMNTQEELRIAFQEYSDGTFVKKIVLS
ncbi:MAG: pirin family protein [Halobacteriota archaeon]